MGDISNNIHLNAWPAISDICLGVAVAKEVAALPCPLECHIASWSIALAAVDRPKFAQAEQSGRTDRRLCAKKYWVLSVWSCLLTFLSLLEVIIGREVPIEYSKLTCFAKVKNRHGSRAVRSTIEVGRSQSSCAYSEAEFDLGKGKNRSKATYPHSKDEDNNHHRHTNPYYNEYESESRSEADVRWSGRSSMYACRCSLHVALPTSLSWSAAAICSCAVWSPLAGLEGSVATGSG